jgi:2-C-methyl-D-erythritol 2,4-cyclodiphosphate synthase
MTSYRIGYGEDAHRLEANLPLFLGGLEVRNSPHGAVAHSDGDALLHAVSDALLSAISAGDIGKHFPDTDPKWKGVSSGDIVRHCLDLVHHAKYRPVNISAVVTLDLPKLGPLRQEMELRLSELLELPAIYVGLTFKTSEGLAPHHVQARATVLLTKIKVGN